MGLNSDKTSKVFCIIIIYKPTKQTTNTTCTSRVPCDIDGRRNVFPVLELARLDGPWETQAVPLFRPSSPRWWWRPEVYAFYLPATLLFLGLIARRSYPAVVLSSSRPIDLWLWPPAHRRSASTLSRHLCGHVSVRNGSCLTRPLESRRWPGGVLPLARRTDWSAARSDQRRWPVGWICLTACFRA